MASQQFCTFLLSGYLFGVPVPQVQEVIRFQPMTPVPLAPPAVEGMINLWDRLCWPSICGGGWRWRSVPPGNCP